MVRYAPEMLNQLSGLSHGWWSKEFLQVLQESGEVVPCQLVIQGVLSLLEVIEPVLWAVTKPESPGNCA